MRTVHTLFLFFSVTLTSVNLKAEDYLFSAIEKLPDQAVAAIVMAEVYRQLGLNLDVAFMPGLRAQKSASLGYVDGEVMRIFSYGDETPNVLRIPTPFYNVKTVAYVNKGSNIIIRNKQHLGRYTVAIVRGVKHTDSVTKHLHRKNVKLLNDPQTMINFLMHGRADVALTNPLEGMLALKSLGADNLELVQEPLATFPLYHYVHKRHAEIVPLLDSKVLELKRNNELERLFRQSEQQIIDGWDLTAFNRAR